LSVPKVIRKVHWCGSCDGRIQPGEAYLTHTSLAGDEFGYHEWLDRDTLKPVNQPHRTKECAGCATRYGRGDLLGEAPDAAHE
jgi:hypothetical protein